MFIYFFWMLRHPVFSSLTCDFRDTMPRQRSLTLLPRETEDFHRGGNHSKHMPPLTHLAWLQPIYCNSRSIFIHISITKNFFCGENFNKKYSFFSGPVLKKKNFFPGSVLKIFFSKFSFKNIFFQVQFLKIFFSWFSSKNFFFQVHFLKCYFLPGSVLKILFSSRFSFWE